MSDSAAKPKVPASKPPLAIRAIRKLWRLATDRPYRHMMLLYRRPPREAFQPFHTTKADRYPFIFKFVQNQLGADSPIKILSFGCSTGEEVFSLRQYFPQATIKGIDINIGNIAACRKRLKRIGDPAIAFETASSTSGEATASYDAIFCMAVLRHGGLGAPGVTRCDPLLRFADFAAAIDDFSRCLKSGGLFVLRFSNFRLCDTPAGRDFETILHVKIPENANLPLFGPDNRLMPEAEYTDTVFRKRSF